MDTFFEVSRLCFSLLLAKWMIALLRHGFHEVSQVLDREEVRRKSDEQMRQMELLLSITDEENNRKLIKKEITLHDKYLRKVKRQRLWISDQLSDALMMIFFACPLLALTAYWVSPSSLKNTGDLLVNVSRYVRYYAHGAMEEMQDLDRRVQEFDK